MEPNDYRLERWLAIILSLLFFLPFVARADEILRPDLYVDSVPYKDGEMFLAIGENELVPVKIRVKQVEPLEDVHSGKLIFVDENDDTYFVRGKNLRRGPIVRATPDAVSFVQGRSKATIAFGVAKFALAYDCTDERCTLVLSGNGISQELVTPLSDDTDHHIRFAGDLDRDGRLDLIANDTLWLSSAAKPGQLVGKSAELSQTSGC